MEKHISTHLKILILASFFISNLASAQDTGSGALGRLAKILQNNRTFAKCTVETKVGDIRFGGAEFGRPQEMLIQVSFTAPDKSGKPVVREFTFTDAQARLMRNSVYNSETQKYDKDVLIEIITATELNSQYSTAPDLFMLSHRGDGKIASIEISKASASLNGKGPSYSSSSLYSCLE